MSGKPRVSAITLHRASHVLEVGFDSGETFRLPCEYLRVHSPSAEVQGHGPSQRMGLGADDWEAWRAMEKLHDDGHVRLLGISNVSLEQLRLLCEGARVRPKLVQNRCFAVSGWDREVRAFCRDRGMIYQGFSLLTANRQALARPEMVAVAALYARTIPQIVFRFAMQIGLLPLTGTTSEQHMREDLQVFDLQLTAEEVRVIEGIGTD